MSHFFVNGPVPLGSAAYVDRTHDSLIREAIHANRWVLFLGPRQHGKTSTIVRLKREFKESGLLAAKVDVQALPPCDTYQALLMSFSQKLAADLGVADWKEPASHLRLDLSSYLQAVIPLGAEPVVVFVDEAAGIRNAEWRWTFYGQLRSLANERAEAAEGHVAGRLRLVFVGTFRPEQLVDEVNSPFNVCDRIESADLSRDQARSLWQAVCSDTDFGCVDAAYELVGGQPYLLQRLLDQTQHIDSSERMSALEAAADRLRSGEDDHFEGVFSKIVGDEELLRLVSSLTVGPIPNEPASGSHRYLQVLGIARREGVNLVFRNPLYARLAAASPQISTTSIPQHAPALLYVPADEAFAFIADSSLREFAQSSCRGAVRSYMSGSFRLALTGFGAATEAILLDWLLRTSAGTLQTAVSRARLKLDGRYEIATQPMTWRLSTMLAVAEKLGAGKIDAPDAVRQYRNLIHPAAALANYRSEMDLEPEARTASGLFSALLRDISRLK
jgi:hypothetical protein